MLTFTKNPKIRSDSMGDGHYLAPRGNHIHQGVDWEARPYEEIYTPIDCKIIRLAYPYVGDLYYKGLLIGNKYMRIKIFYISPLENIIGKFLKAGDIIGYAQDITKKYGKNMTNHIHTEMDSFDLNLLVGKL